MKPSRSTFPVLWRMGRRVVSYRILKILSLALTAWSLFPPTGNLSFRPDRQLNETQDGENTESLEDIALERASTEANKSDWFPMDPMIANLLGYEFGRMGRRDPAFWLRLPDFLPSPSETISMLARDRDVDNFGESSAIGGLAGEHYGKVVSLVPIMRPRRDSYVAFFSAIHREMVSQGLAKPSDGSVHPISKKGESSPPSRGDMDVSHSFALDIFFTEVLELPFSNLEVGPDILSASGGIVISTSTDWTGGPGIETYQHGGISPNAGNGAIIFDPNTKRYYCYFHLHDVHVYPGMPVDAGSFIGKGGDTGSNARKPGHGQHLHLEIFDAVSGRFLRNTEIRKLIF